VSLRSVEAATRPTAPNIDPAVRFLSPGLRQLCSLVSRKDLNELVAVGSEMCTARLLTGRPSRRSDHNNAGALSATPATGMPAR